MSFISKVERQKCWDSRDRYWDCLDTNAEDHDRCLKLRQAYENSCPAQWVKHFDRKRDYLKFKARIEKEGYEPLDKISALPSEVPQSTSPLQTVTRRHRVYKELVTTCIVIPQHTNDQFMSFHLYKVHKLISFFSLQTSFCIYELRPVTKWQLFPVPLLGCCQFLIHLECTYSDCVDLPTRAALKNLY